MKTLPKYFIILRDATNPLWGKYIQWLRTTYNAPWTGVLNEYYGHDDTKTLTHCHKRPDQFLNNPTIITLDYWNECVNGCSNKPQLPEKWCINFSKVSDVDKKWFITQIDNSYNRNCYENENYVFYHFIGLKQFVIGTFFNGISTSLTSR